MMISAEMLASLAGASVVTSALLNLVGRLFPRLRTPLTALVASEAILFTGALLTARLDLGRIVILMLNGLVVAAGCMGGLEAFLPPSGRGPGA